MSRLNVIATRPRVLQTAKLARTVSESQLRAAERYDYESSWRSSSRSVRGCAAVSCASAAKEQIRAPAKRELQRREVSASGRRLCECDKKRLTAECESLMSTDHWTRLVSWHCQELKR